MNLETAKMSLPGLLVAISKNDRALDCGKELVARLVRTEKRADHLARRLEIALLALEACSADYGDGAPSIAAAALDRMSNLG
jgi:hypothetical protein